MKAEDKEAIEDGQETVRALLEVANRHVERMALSLASMPYSDDGKALVLARAEIEGAKKLIVVLRRMLK